MTQFEAFDDGAEVDGQAIRPVSAGIGELSPLLGQRSQETLGEHDYRVSS